MNQFQKKLVIVLAALALGMGALAFVIFGSYTELKSISKTYKANLDSTAKWRRADAQVAHPQTRAEAAKFALERAKHQVDSLFAADTTNRAQHWDSFRDELGNADSLVGEEIVGQDSVNQHW